MKKRWAVGIGTAAVVIGLGGYLFFQVEAKKGVLTGLESKVSEKVQEDKSFRVLEIVPDGVTGEFGYTVKTSDTDIVEESMDAYLAEYLKEDESHQNTPEIRKKFINDYEKSLGQALGTGTDTPITKKQGYQEAYFPEDTENWKVLNFSQDNYETAVLKGVYERAEEKGEYTANMTGVQYNKELGEYQVVFSDTMREDTEEALYRQPYVCLGTDETNGMDIYQPADENSQGDLFYIESIQYVGKESEEGCYEAVLDENLPYSYDAENGEYCFRPDEGATEIPVQIARIFYQYDLINNDWFRTKVLSSKDSDRLKIEVITIEEKDLKTQEGQEDIDNADFIYVCGDTAMSGKTYGDAAAVWAAIGTVVSENKVPCMIDASTQVWKECGTYTEEYRPRDYADYVKENLYIVGRPDGREPFFARFESWMTYQGGITEVKAFVERENLIRRINGPTLDTSITRAFLMQYIVDYARQRKVEAKDSIHVLEIQPTDAASADTTGFVLTADHVRKWAGVGTDTEVIIDSMSTAEYIGKKINLFDEYDLIYIGACIDYFNTEGEGEEKHTVYNDTRMNGLIYTHTGDYVAGNIAIAGMMDVDYGGAYAFRDQEPRPYAKNAEYTTQLGNTYQGYLLHNNGGGYTAIRNRTEYVDGILRQNFKKPYPQTQYSYASLIPPKFNSTTEELSGDLMIYRYSGNDLTREKYKELYFFEYYGCPIVISDALYHTDEKGKKTVNEEAVDNTSYMYRFLDKEKNSGVYSVKQAEAGDSKLQLNINMERLKLLYFDPDAPGEPEPYTPVEMESGSLFTDQSKMKITREGTSSHYKARVGIYLENKAESASTTSYRPYFYLDMNSDGSFTEKSSGSEQMSCYIYNVDTGEEAEKDSKGVYMLRSRVRYCLEREIPASYNGVLAWKLAVKSGNYVTSDIQYTRMGGNGGEQNVKVLQITSQNSKGESNNLIDLSTDKYVQNYLKQIRATTGLNFQIDTIGGYDFGNTTAESAEEFYNKQLPNLGYSLEEYDMLIIGFADQYYDLYNSEIPNSQYAVEAIHLFVDSGKSVMFSHDTTSFVNISPHHSFKDGHLTGLSDDWEVPQQWGYYMNNAFRNLLAMDRYGITADTDSSLEYSDKKLGALLRQQQHLTVQSANTDYDKRFSVNEGFVYSYGSALAYEDSSEGKSPGSFLTRNLDGENMYLKNLRKWDIAYAAKTYNSANNTAQAYGQTHGLNNATLNDHLVTNEKYLTQFHQEGKGWGQKWTQYRNLRNDLLPETGSGSDGQVRAKVTQENDGLITHYPYEIGTEFKSAETHAGYYQLNLEQDNDTDEKGDVVVWYCLSDDAESSTSEKGKVYRNNKNDARNNYYLYSTRNVTYTGVGHSALDHSGKDLETKLLVNSIVAAYRNRLVDPEIKILEIPDENAAEKKYEYLLFNTDEYSMGSSSGYSMSDEFNFYVWISDSNLTSSNKNFSVKFTYLTPDGEEKNLGGTLLFPDTGKQVYSRDIKNGVYLWKVRRLRDVFAREQSELVVKATVTCSFNYYGTTVKRESSTTIRVLKEALFELN